MYGNTTPLASRSAQAVTVDNLMRRALRVSDPSDPGQVANGLLSRYPEASDQMERERLGLNHRSVAEPKMPEGTYRGASGSEIAQARDDLERDLETLTGASELKDISVELKGWGGAVRKAAAEGLAAAPIALDVVQHDRAMAARRTLGDYARLARFVGTLTSDGTPRFRRLAQSLDVLGALILVGIGEGLAANGVTRGTAIIRVAASELRTRRDAVIAALRALTGSGLTPLGQDDYPRGLEAHRILVSQLEATGQSDLRALLDEATMGSALDHLVDLAAGSTAGLRELTTASSILIGRLSRLRSFCQAIDQTLGNRIPGSPDSPPMAYFASALQMFIDAFQIGLGSRLIFIARPSIVTYGLYGVSGLDQASQVLQRIAFRRNQIAERIDCHAGCPCEVKTVRRQIILDYLLERIDRAIDLHAVGSGNGDPEIAATTSSHVFRRATANLADRLAGIDPVLKQDLDQMAVDLQGSIPPALHPTLVRELSTSYFAEERLEKLVTALAPSCFPNASRVRKLIKGMLGGKPIPQTRTRLPQPSAVSLDAISGNTPLPVFPA